MLLMLCSMLCRPNLSKTYKSSRKWRQYVQRYQILVEIQQMTMKSYQIVVQFSVLGWWGSSAAFGGLTPSSFNNQSHDLQQKSKQNLINRLRNGNGLLFRSLTKASVLIVLYFIFLYVHSQEKSSAISLMSNTLQKSPSLLSIQIDKYENISLLCPSKCIL